MTVSELSPTLVQRLKGRVLALTGAGISVASGLHTFRGPGGLYENGGVQALCTPEGFAADPLRVWNWYLMRIASGKDAQPNPAHLALVELERLAAEFALVTSNVDPLHERAGSKHIQKLHGDILQRRCMMCGIVEPMKPEALPDHVDDLQAFTCSCGGLFRPNVVWFGEMPNQAAVYTAIENIESAHILLEVGLSGTVTYHFAEAAASRGVPVLRINPDAQPHPEMICIDQPAEIALPELVSRLR
jgi:NAD-dependent deacetylase